MLRFFAAPAEEQLEYDDQQGGDGFHVADSRTCGLPGQPFSLLSDAPRTRFVAGEAPAYAPPRMTATDPIVVSVDLAATPARAFSAFADQFEQWWPVATHSLSRDAATRCSLDATPGGLFEERAPDGTRQLWGTVESIEPGRRIRFSWHPGREPASAQWVEVVFAPRAAGSRVTLTHGGWGALGEIAPILRREYATGWQSVLGKIYADFVDRAS